MEEYVQPADEKCGCGLQILDVGAKPTCCCICCDLLKLFSFDVATMKNIPEYNKSG